MAELHRITTQYIPIEDRVRLAGESSRGEPVVIWLTQRLLGRMLPVLLRWLEPHDAGSLQADMKHSFAQQAAEAEWTPAEPVVPTADSAAWVVQTIDVTQSDKTMQLLFKGGGDHERIEIAMEAQPLRQWLAILYRAYQVAEWPSGAWPIWLANGALPAEHGTVLH